MPLASAGAASDNRQQAAARTAVSWWSAGFSARHLSSARGHRLLNGQPTAAGPLPAPLARGALFPDFTAKAGEVIGIDCELCSGDGGPRVDRTFVYSSPSSVGTPSTFGRVRLVGKLDPADLKGVGKALLPLSVLRSGNYGWVYGTVLVSPTIAKQVKTVEGKLLDGEGKVKATSAGSFGAGRDAQSMAFFKTAVIELLYSGAAIRKPSWSMRSRLNLAAAGGRPPAASRSWSNSGIGYVFRSIKVTSAPAASAPRAATRTSFLL